MTVSPESDRSLEDKQDRLTQLRAKGLTQPATPGALARALAQVDDLPAIGLAAALAEQRDDDR